MAELDPFGGLLPLAAFYEYGPDETAFFLQGFRKKANTLIQDKQRNRKGLCVELHHGAVRLSLDTSCAC